METALTGDKLNLKVLWWPTLNMELHHAVRWHFFLLIIYIKGETEMSMVIFVGWHLLLQMCVCTYRNVKTSCILLWNPSDITSDLSIVCPLYTSLSDDWQGTHLSIPVAAWTMDIRISIHLIYHNEAISRKMETQQLIWKTQWCIYRNTDPLIKSPWSGKILCYACRLLRVRVHRQWLQLLMLKSFERNLLFETKKV